MKFYVNLKSTKSESDFKAGFSATALSHLIKNGPSQKPSQNWSKIFPDSLSYRKNLTVIAKQIIGESWKTHPKFFSKFQFSGVDPPIFGLVFRNGSVSRAEIRSKFVSTMDEFSLNRSLSCFEVLESATG